MPRCGATFCLDSIQADYVLVPVNPLGEYSTVVRQARARLRERYEPVWSTQARPNYECAALPYQMVRKLDWSHSFVHAVLTTRALGRTLELYKLKPKRGR